MPFCAEGSPVPRAHHNSPGPQDKPKARRSSPRVPYPSEPARSLPIPWTKFLYRRFIPQFAKVAQPLHQLTRKEVNLSGVMSAILHLRHTSRSLPVLQYWPIRHLTSCSPWRQTQASRALVRYSLRNRKMGSSIQLHMQAVRCRLQNATIASPSWRHLP